MKIKEKKKEMEVKLFDILERIITIELVKNMKTRQNSSKLVKTYDKVLYVHFWRTGISFF